MAQIVEHMKIQSREMIKRNDFLEEQNGLIRKQNTCLAISARHAKRMDEFNRKVYQDETGHGGSDGPEDEAARNEIQETRQGEIDALNEMFFGDISIGGLEEE